MLNKAILELNGVFNINKQPNQRLNQQPATATVDSPLKAVDIHKEYVDPVLIPEDFSVTMKNYHEAAHIYNNKVVAENLDTKTYNNNIDIALQKEPLQRQEQLILIEFYKMISHLDTWERNDRIVEFNRCNRPMATKDKIQTLKDPAQLIFTAILYEYGGQLKVRSKQRKELREKIPGLNIPGALPFVSIHTGNITKKKLDKESEAQRLNICQKTLRRQRKRLQEANILQDYIFEGSSRPVKVLINPEILSITDNYSGGKAPTDNQQVKESGRTQCPHRYVSIRTLLNNSKIKANVNKHSKIRSSASGLTSFNFSFYKNTRQQVEEKLIAPAEKSMTLSDFFRQKIEEPGDLIQNLATGRYDTYEPLRMELLEKEAYSGALDREEFKTLVIQDFFKTAAKLWKNKTPYAGSWGKAYNTWQREKFITHSGDPSNKHIVFKRIKELRYRLKMVRRYLKNHPDFQLLFPGEYFDTTRTTAKEGGFEYTVKSWKKHLKYEESKEKVQQETRIKSGKRKKKNSDRQKIDAHVKGYLKGKFDLQELFTKTEQLGNRELVRDLPEIIKKALKKFNFKSQK